MRKLSLLVAIPVIAALAVFAVTVLRDGGSEASPGPAPAPATPTIAPTPVRTPPPLDPLRGITETPDGLTELSPTGNRCLFDAVVRLKKPPGLEEVAPVGEGLR